MVMLGFTNNVQPNLRGWVDPFGTEKENDWLDDLSDWWDDTKAGAEEVLKDPGDFLDFLLDSENNGLNDNPAWEFLASDAIDAVNKVREGDYSDAAISAALAVLKPLKLGSKLKGCSFEAGTPVATPNGLSLIESLKEGDLVLSKDEATGEIAFSSTKGFYFSD